jgi:amino acid permease
MLGGLILIYFVGKAFSELAHEYNKSRWGFAILGVVSYYIGLLIGGILIGIAGEIIAPDFVDNTSDILLGLMCVPFGVLTCWLTYRLLKKSWSKPKDVETHTLDGGLINNDSDR